MKKSYSELVRLSTYEDRLSYLKENGLVGEDTFGFDRYLNQNLYKSAEWQRARNYVILRDNGCDVGLDDYPIPSKVYVHHINPITKDDILNHADCLFDPENLVCVSHETHNLIHYGCEAPTKREPVMRSRNDTRPWRLSND